MIGTSSMPPAAVAEFGDRAGRVAADEEERVERAVAHLVAGLVGLQVLGLDVLLGEAVRREDDARVDQRARARLVERHALALAGPRPT